MRTFDSSYVLKQKTMPLATITVMTPFEKRDVELENTLIPHFTKMIQEYDLKSCDLDLLIRVVAQMEKVTLIEMAEDIEEVNLEEDNG